MRMEYNFVVFSMGAHFFKFMYQEMLNMENVQVYWNIEHLLQLLSPLERRIAMMHLYSKIRLPFKRIWYYRALSKIHFGDDKPICFIWHYRFITLIENRMPLFLKQKYPDSKQIYFFTDPWGVNTKFINELNQQMNKVAVFDPLMAKKFNLSFFPNVYPMVSSHIPKEYKYDICFIGEDKGREKILHIIAKLCQEHSVKAAFFIKKFSENGLGLEAPLDAPENIHYLVGTEKIAYTETVEIVKDSRCILELGVSPDYTCSLRVQEAVVLNRKLLTNNLNIQHMPCCEDSKWISYFEKPEDIDWQFVMKDEQINYHYKGEYSANTWLSSIQKCI